MTTMSITASAPTKGAWIAYHPDWSAWTLYETEIDALRAAVGNGQQVMFCPWRRNPREELEREAKRATATKAEVDRFGDTITGIFGPGGVTA
jgi:hypothetical protein